MIRFRAPALASVDRELARRARYARDPRPLLEALGDRMVNHSIPENFQKGGRPGRWPGIRRQGQVMRDSGGLLESIVDEVAGSTLRVGTNKSYAAQRHFGGTVKGKGKLLAIPVDPSNKRRPKHYGKRLRWAPVKKKGGNVQGLLVERQAGRRGKAGKVVTRFLLVREVTQPARPFLLFQPDDIAWAQRVTVRELAGPL